MIDILYEEIRDMEDTRELYKATDATSGNTSISFCSSSSFSQG
jgi:hypothetical protein